MKHRHPHTGPPVVPAKHRQHDKGAQQLDEKSSTEKEFRQPDDPADLRRRNGILHGTSLHQRNFSLRQHDKKDGYRDNAKTTDLPVSSTTSPVTQTAEVAVKSVLGNGVTQPSADASGSISNNAPTRMTPANPKIMI